MKDIKTRSSEKTLRILTDAARAPRELARKSLIESKEKVKEAAERRQPQDESPEQYAENRIEQTAEEAVHRAGAVQHSLPTAIWVWSRMDSSGWINLKIS